MTAVTTVASGIAFGAYDVAIAGGVEHMGRHPMGEGVDPNPRILAEKLVDPSALVMGSTAENLHDHFPEITRDRADAFAVLSQQRVAAAYADGVIQESLVPVATRSRRRRMGAGHADEPPRPGTTTATLAGSATPFRPHGRVTPGNAAGLNDGATACLVAAESVAAELGLPTRHAAGVVRLRRRRSRADGHRTGPGHRTRAAHRPAWASPTSAPSRSTRRSRSRCSRSCDHFGLDAATTLGSTRTAARSPSATRWPAPACG